MPKNETISGLLENRAAAQGERLAFVFLSHTEAGVVEERLTCAGLDARARAIAASLAAEGAAGERVALLLPPGPDFVASFLGCLYAGAVAVPALPPRRRSVPGGDLRLAAICRDARPRVALATAAHLPILDAAAGEIPELAAAHRMAPATAGGEGWRRPDVGPETLAFLQYTSGSTSTPKGVRVSHGNLLHNEELIRHAFAQSADSVVLGWLPLYHDMGLIGTVLQPLYTGAVAYLMTPGAFLQRPARWLEAIARYRATTSGGPDFAYDLCVRKVGAAEREGLDLSSWRVAFDGAEPVRAGTLSRFAAAFAPCGFRAAAFRPCYGLAEATLLVSGWRDGGEPRVLALAAAALERQEAVAVEAGEAGRELVGCGAPQQTVLAVDAETGVPCPAGRIGEIWVAGPSVAQGYWERPEETAATFGARLADGGGPFLRTGDLGFLAGGELFLTGRLKDLIILRGRNHYPQDLELTAERSHAGLRAGGSAAFAVEVDGEERLVVVCEVERRLQLQAEDWGAMAAAVRRAVAEEHGVPVDGIALLRTGTIPKTSSGKIRRRESRARYLTGGLEEIYRGEARPAGAERLLTRLELLALAPAERAAALTTWLCEEIACRTGTAAGAVGPETGIAAAGLDSLGLFALEGRLEAEWGCALPAAALAELSVAQLSALLLDRLAEGPEPREADLPARVPGEVLGDHPASFGQEALWLVERAAAEAGEEGVLHLVGAARLGHAVDAPALLRAAQALVARHPALRTTFGVREGELRQQVHARLPPDVAAVEAAAWSPAALDAALRCEARRRLDLAAGSPLRLRLFARPGGERVLLLVLHHLVGDFGSLAALLGDWAALYARELAGDSPALPPLPAAYTDFARGQRQWFSGPAGERLERYWLDRLHGAPPGLDLPTDRPRPRTASHAGARVGLRLAPDLTGRLRALACAHGVTLFTTLLALFQALLGRLAGQDDLLVGSPATLRRDPAFDGVVGYFVNPVMLRADLAGDPPVAAFLARTRRSVAAALEHRDLPFARLARLLQPGREGGRPPVAQVFFALHREAPGQPPGLAGFALGQAGPRFARGGLALESLALDPGTSQLELTLFAAEIGDALVLSCEHATALFDGATIRRWLGHLETLLDAAAARPEARLGELPLLGAGERQQLLVEWSDTAVSPRQAACLHDLFEAQARRTPEAVALVDGTREITYRELDQAAERLAARLRAHGAGPEVLVGVWLERSADLVAALLAILKAGAAYLPLDPRQPRPRLAAMLASARVGLVASRGSLAAELPWNGPWVLVDGEDAPAGPRAPAGRAAPENLAYVLHTSGSTGTPKGVAVTHGSAVEMVRWAGGAFAREELAGVLAATSLSFDMSVFELFAPLSFGGTAILAQDVLALPALPARGRVTLVDTVPSAMAELVRAASLGPSVRTVNLGGEALPHALAEQLYATGTVERVWNLYGPSEDTTFSTASRVRPQSAAAPHIGRPIAATRAWVLAPGTALAPMEPQPVGVAGELYLGGGGLARGYLHRPELTAERFVPDPWPREPGARLYRTGDLVRHRGDGALELLGRLDHQVKIRGFRVELGEIEAALRALAGVRAAAVAVREDRAGGPALVAYVVGDAVAETLRRSLQERLPEHMVPAAFVTLAALPLNANGKLDRQALPAPAGPRPGEHRQAPRTATEEILAGLWAELLGVERVEGGDDFFALGGHSLLGTRMTARLRAAFGLELPLHALFEAPGLADFAARVDAALHHRERAGAAGTAPPLVAVPRRSPGGLLPLSFAQRRLWLLDQLEPGSPLYNMAGALRLEGPFDGGVLARCLAEIVRRHEALRTVFAARDGEAVQEIRPPSGFALPVVDLSGLAATAREALALALLAEEAARPFDLAAGPLLRGALLRLAGEDHLAALTLHHIAGDGWSLGLLARELTALYAALAAGRPSPLPELAVQYADFALWQRAWLHGEMLEAEIDFWRRRLAGLPPLFELPTDRPRPTVQSYRGATRPLRLPAALAGQLAALARREGATLFMVLLAGFEVLLARWSGQEDLAVGSPVAGRNRVEVEGLIGFFVNTLVLRGDLHGAPPFHELLGRVRETALAAYLHQDVPFEKLVDELAPERSLTYAPLFQVMLALQNAPGGSLEIEGLRLRPVRVETATAKFDLTLSLEEQEDGLAGTVEYATDLFDGATIERLMAGFARLLAGLAEPGDRPALEIELLTAAELLELARANDTARDYPRAAIHELFAEQAARAPNAVAVTAGGRERTYGEIARDALRLAHRLRGAGVGPGSPVGLCAEGLVEKVVGMLGILAAGGAYVPLDLAYPPERLAFLLDDTGAAVLVAEEGLAGRLPARAGLLVEWVDSEGVDVGGASEGTLANLSSPGDPAYILYTSGSTGRPKGVVVPHRAVVRLVRGTDYVELGPGDRVAQVSNSSFDAATFEIWGALLNGGRLVGIERATLLSPEELTEALRREGVGVLFLTTALFNQVAREAPGGFATLRDLLFGGERVDPAAVRAVLAAGPPNRLLHVYGPTETTTFATWQRVEAVPPGDTVPIGRPLANGTLHVLSPGLAVQPAGVPGELYLGGDGLAQGYHARPELTAERFVPDPFGREPGGRLYRTGDLVRRRPDGALEILGRLDGQVKIRGFRIEPGEVEAVLAALPGVREAAVVAREDAPGDRRLVAYVVGDTAGEAEVDALRRSLQERLPDYLVPAAFVALAALPLTPNGKVDRKALPAPEPPAARAGYTAPRSHEEEILAAVWAQVLRLPRVGVDDNFFELGGDSILSVQIVARARQLGLLLTVRQIFEHQTVAGLARHLTLDPTADSGALGPGQAPVAGEVPLTPIQRWFFDQGFADPHHFNQALLLEPLEPLDTTALERALAAVVEHHDALRLRFDRAPDALGGWRQENAPAEPVVPFHRIDLSRLPAPCRRRALDAAAAPLQAGFDLSTGPLTRLAFFDAGAGRPGWLLWISHHLVVDGVSWRVLVEDLEAAYRQAARGGIPTLPPKTTSFRQWAHRLAAHAGSAALSGELAGWCETARTAVPPLPVDFPAGGRPLIADEATVSFELEDGETAELLLALPQVFHNRVDEALLSALARAVAGWSGAPRLRVDLEGHGREQLFADLDVSRTVGWFTSLYPVVFEAGDAGPGDALLDAKERLRAVPERGIGYGLLRHLRNAGDDGEAEALRLLRAAPAAGILFNYLGQVDSAAGERSIFRASSLSAGPTRSPRAHRTHAWEIGGLVAEGRLRITLTYDSRTHRRETAERLAAAYAEALRQLLRHARRSEEVFTPADFPKAKLDSRGFGKLAALLAESD